MDKKKFTMDREQKVNDGRLEADHRRLDYRNFTDDEEVTLLPHKRDTDVRTIRFRRSVMGYVRYTTRRLATSDGASPWGSSKVQ